MSQSAILFAPVDALPDAPWPWLLGVDGEPPREGSGLAALASVLAETPAPLLLVLPGEAVLATRVSVPARSRSQLAAALPYVVEEHLAVDVEDVHIASGPRDADGRIPVRVVDRALLHAWLDALHDAGLSPDGARLDADALPWPDAHGIEVQADTRRASVRTRDAAFTVPREDLTALLALIVEQDPDADWHLSLAAVDAEAMDLAALEPTLAQHGRVRIEREARADTPAERLATLAARPGPEVLTGPFAPTRRTPARAGRWRLVAGLAALWFLTQAGLDLGRSAWLEARTAELREEALTAFRQVFPDRTRSPDPRRELEGLLGTGSGGSAAFLDLLGVVAAELDEVGGAVALRTVNFNAARGDLAVDLNLSGIAAVDRFKAGVEASGLAVTIDSAVQEASGVRARVRIAAPASGDSA